MNGWRRWVGAAALGLATLGAGASLERATAEEAAEEDRLRLIGDARELAVETDEGALTVTRRMTPCAKIGGVLQPMVPVEGVTPVGEIEVLEAMKDPDTLLVDMRTVEWFVETTIPTAMNVPYVEVADRLDDFGCEPLVEGWDCAQAKTVLAFCNGPACPQSPTAIRAMHRQGFPMEKVLYYRGGMQSWDALGLTTVEGGL